MYENQLKHFFEKELIKYKKLKKFLYLKNKEISKEDLYNLKNICYESL